MNEPNIEYTNLITQNQEVEKLIPIIGKENIIGFQYDYPYNVMSEINQKLLVGMGGMNEFAHQQCLYFSFSVTNLKDMKFSAVEDLMHKHPFASVIYDMAMALPYLVSLHIDRIYYTKYNYKEHPRGVVYPMNKDSQEASACCARGEYGKNRPIYERLKETEIWDIIKGPKYDKLADNRYTVHFDFRLIFDFSDTINIFKHFLKATPKWTGVYNTLLVWGVRHQRELKDIWLRSEKYLIEYKDYQCSLRKVHYDYYLLNDEPIEVFRPKTYEWWKGKYLNKLREAGFDVINGELFTPEQISERNSEDDSRADDSRADDIDAGDKADTDIVSNEYVIKETSINKKISKSCINKCDQIEHFKKQTSHTKRNKSYYIKKKITIKSDARTSLRPPP